MLVVGLFFAAECGVDGDRNQMIQIIAEGNAVPNGLDVFGIDARSVAFDPCGAESIVCGVRVAMYLPVLSFRCGNCGARAAD
jgi:hypothetical protein